jgi:hypothetical protein
MATFALHKTAAAPIEAVFDVLTDHAGYAKILPVRSVTMEQEGEPSPNGVGAIRVLRLAGPPVREQVTEYVRPTRFSYTALSGLPAKEYGGTVELSPNGAGTDITYRVTTVPRPPLPEVVWVAIMRQVIGRLIGAVIKEAERRA